MLSHFSGFPIDWAAKLRDLKFNPKKCDAKKYFCELKIQIIWIMSSLDMLCCPKLLIARFRQDCDEWSNQKPRQNKADGRGRHWSYS